MDDLIFSQQCPIVRVTAWFHNDTRIRVVKYRYNRERLHLAQHKLFLKIMELQSVPEFPLRKQLYKNITVSLKKFIVVHWLHIFTDLLA